MGVLDKLKAMGGRRGAGTAAAPDLPVGADLNGADLRGPFDAAVFKGADIGAALQSAALRQAAEAPGADFNGAHLSSWDRSGSMSALEGVDFRGVSFPDIKVCEGIPGRGRGTLSAAVPELVGVCRNRGDACVVLENPATGEPRLMKLAAFEAAAAKSDVFAAMKGEVDRMVEAGVLMVTDGVGAADMDAIRARCAPPGTAAGI
jgi:hypothetical protein